MQKSLLLLLFVFGGFVANNSPAAELMTFRVGQPLRDALDQFANAGLNIVSTSRIVPRRLTVTRTPNGQDGLQAQAQTMLLPHGLELVMVDDGNAFVRRVTTTPPIQETRKEPLPATQAPGIEELIVTSRYRIHRDTSQVNALDHQDLQSLPSLGRDVLRSIEVLPGIASSGVSARHQFRGGDVNEVLYRIDGVELLEPFHLRNMQSLFSAVNFNIVDSVNVYVAGFPVTMGSRMSGVVDLDLVEPSESFAGSVDINPITSAVDARGWVDEWSWLISGRRSLIDKTLELFETDYGTPRFHDEFARLSHTTADRTLTATLFNSTDRITVTDDTEAGRSNSDYQAGWLRWEQDHSDRLRSVWQLNGVSIENDRQGIVNVPDNATGALSEARDFTNLEVSNSWELHIDETWDLQAGWSLAQQKGKFLSEFTSQYGPIALPIQGVSEVQRITRIDRSGESISAYLSLNKKLTDRLALAGGIRYDGQDIDPVHVSEVSARFNIEYEATPQWHLSLNVGRYTQQQHLYEVQIDDGKVELDPPQHSDQINLTSIWTASGSINVRVDVYHRRINNPWSHFENLYNRWVLFPELQGDRFEILASKGRLRGAEVSLNHQGPNNVSWHMHYAFSEAQDKYLGKLRARPWDQQHSFKAGLRWHSDKWRLGLNATYRSGWPSTPLISASSELAQFIYSENFPRYLTVDAHVSRRFTLPRGSLEIYLDLVNVSNRANIGGYDFTLSGQRSEQHLLPAMPTLGLLWQW